MAASFPKTNEKSYKGYKLNLILTDEQKQQLQKAFEASRYTWNIFLALNEYLYHKNMHDNHPDQWQRLLDKSAELANQLETNLKTLTVDHGKEFANYQSIEEQTGVPLYFAHAYSPHERGSNENRNRVLRRFIPKGQPIEEIRDDELIQINWYLNSRPLKCLNWRTPIEIFLLNLRL